MATNFARPIIFALTSLSLSACGSGGSGASVTQLVDAAGGTLQAGSAIVSIAPNALAAPTQVTVREAEPHHAGRVRRVEIEPSGTVLKAPAQVSVRVDDANVRVKMHDDRDDPLAVEIEDRNHGRYKTSMSQLGAVEVELEHGVACSSACGANEECDDGVCKPHEENAEARACIPLCASGLECDDGACKPHGGSGRD